MLLPKIAELFEITIDSLYGTESEKSQKQEKKIHKYLEEEMEFLPWEDDGRIRVAVFDGKNYYGRMGSIVRINKLQSI